ncbi:isochorismatase family protein [Croceivirga sp. JEA036]|uniref:isochorismatase family protein n=1 Tax=Croceivirga sp. JEA036 TaxID=2721162 RepID=UPI00143C7710|nr:isochorismatase family protein [Croceivirga sp. JEA036]NJB37236.1 isochorismatase family protein [Croceivirga sp. JEA036]
MPKKALLVIDMQKASFTVETPRLDEAGVVKRINTLAAKFREEENLVIIIQHDGGLGGAYEKNSNTWENLDALQTKPTDIFLDKTANDAFYNTALESLLKENGVKEVCITGCATDFCVASTLQSALIKDFNVVAVADGHTTGNRPNLTAEQVVAHYNWVWQDMIATKGSVVVKTVAELTAE